MAINKKTGTKEWAQVNINIQHGCEHNCRYCYARDNAVRRFKRCSAEQWTRPVINQSKVEQSRGKYNGVVMFPSSHDITPKNINECLCVIRKLLDAGNQVLIVSKPHWPCITLMCEKFQAYTQQLMFRFTIGSMDDNVLGFWELKAPKFKERRACLRYAYIKGYSTSVSCEPYLDEGVIDLFCNIKTHLTHSFWIGLLRDFKQRVDLSKVTDEEKEKYVTPLLKAQKKEEVIKLYNEFKNERLVMWKDSVREIVKDGKG